MKNGMKFSTTIYLSAGASALLVLLTSAVIYFNVQGMMKTQKWVSHTDAVIGQFNRVVSLMVDMETGERGFLMSGEKKFLEPYNAAVAGFDDYVKELQKTVSDNPTQVARLAKVMELKKSWLEQSSVEEMKAREAYDAGRMNRADFEALLKVGKGKQFMDQIRSEINAAIKMEEDLNLVRRDENENSGQATTA